MSSVAVKPIALPALALLLPRPLALVGAALTLPWATGWLGPLFSPLPSGGLLGSWWQSTGGAAPRSASDLLVLGRAALDGILATPAWAGTWLLPLAVAGAARSRARRRTRLAVVGPILATLAVAAAFGDRLVPRYLAAPIWACLPWVGALVPRPASAILLWPTAAVITQLSAVRAALDPEAGVPALPVLSFPVVQADRIFDDCSTPGASALRRQAHRLAETLPPGATVRVERRPHGREGELTWPLRVLRPDVHIEVVDP